MLFCMLIIVFSLFIVIVIVFVLQVVIMLDYEFMGVEKSELKKNIGLYLVNIFFFGMVFDEVIQECIIKIVNIVFQLFGYYNVEVVVFIENEDVIINVVLGDLFIVVNVNREIIGEGRDDLVFCERFNVLVIKKGDVLYQLIYEKFKLDMFNYVLLNGYFDFYWQVIWFDLVREENEVNVLLIV